MKPHKTLITVAALAGLLATGGAYAHTDEYLDTQTAPHGGQLRMAGALHFELVISKDNPQPQNNPVVVYVTDHAGTKTSCWSQGYGHHSGREGQDNHHSDTRWRKRTQRLRQLRRRAGLESRGFCHVGGP